MTSRRLGCNNRAADNGYITQILRVSVAWLLDEAELLFVVQ